MDPYLEGHLWPDVHIGLAFLIKEQLAPKISPKYLVQTNTYTVEDTSPEEDVGIMYPDVELFRRTDIVREPAAPYVAGEELAATPSTVTLPHAPTVEVRIPFVEIRDRKNNQLVTAIEILSPVNKRQPGLLPYRKKRERLLAAGVHFLEIDLLRRGQRPFKHPYLPTAHYYVNLTRHHSGKTEIWAFDVKEKLPLVPVPLLAPDKDTLLDLDKALSLLYERSLYHLAIDYAETPPPPAFSTQEQVWIKDLLAKFLAEQG